MDDVTVKVAVYRAVAERGRVPDAASVAAGLGIRLDDLRASYARLAGRRLLVLEPDGLTIRMAPPFSGVPTPHVVRAAGIEYYANCAWDALGIPAALGKPGEVHSRCGQSGEELRLPIETDGPPPSPWLFHCPVPAARWWRDIVFT